MAQSDGRYRKLTTAEAGLILGGVSRNTIRRRCEKGDWPPGWHADKEMRPQGEAWVVYVPIDDPQLAALDAPPPEPPPGPGTPRDAPQAPAASPETIARGISGDLVVAAAIGPVMARLVEVEQLAIDQAAIVGRLSAERDGLAVERDALQVDRDGLLDERDRLRAMVAGLQQQLALAEERARLASLPAWRRVWGWLWDPVAP